MKDLGEKLENLLSLPSAAIVITEEEEKYLRELQEKGFFTDIIIVNSEYQYRVAKDGGAKKLAIREETVPKILADANKHYYIIV